MNDDMTPDDFAHLQSVESDLNLHLEEWAQWNGEIGLTTLSCLLLRVSIELTLEVHGPESAKDIMQDIFTGLTEEEENGN